MPQTSWSTPATVQSVSAANEAIRTFMAERAGRGLWPEEQDAYEKLLTDWAAAVHRKPAPA
ncbi:hypothetical protein [Streptomyces pinistramenti]|uniref:hypothetical protein n=1 Tax=Streptomyces pinistramenti TaxID=2884812 RepID=UPI001D05ED10|nr:hypothetical protein [Streptomyces pinistramenti]MCB5910841.1 hypothetical protein [Streptomyces pinistramenti]